mgnify:CR=1 FL=1
MFIFVIISWAPFKKFVSFAMVIIAIDQVIHRQSQDHQVNSFQVLS